MEDINDDEVDGQRVKRWVAKADDSGVREVELTFRKNQHQPSLDSFDADGRERKYPGSSYTTTSRKIYFRSDVSKTKVEALVRLVNKVNEKHGKVWEQAMKLEDLWKKLKAELEAARKEERDAHQG